MSNEEVYAAGLLTRALDPATQPPEIRAFLQAEVELLQDVITDGTRVIDIGCGTGRHLLLLADRLRLGVGVDYEHSYIAEAHRRAGGRPLHFVTADATAVPVRSGFDFAMCLTNTWGTMSDKAGVIGVWATPCRVRPANISRRRAAFGPSNSPRIACGASSANVPFVGSPISPTS